MKGRFVQVKAFDSYVTAHIELARLLDQDINCHLLDEHTITIDPLLIPIVGGIKLMVFESQVQRALEILSEPDFDA